MINGYGMMGDFALGFGGIFMILWWVLIVVGIVALVKWLTAPHGSTTPGRGALDILKERYARGEIEREEFEQKRRDLEA